MSSNIEEIEESIRVALTPGFRLNLLARGQSRSMIWRDGILPTDAPPFSPILSYDLLSYGYSLLSHALRLFEGGGDVELARRACEHAGEAIEAVVAKGPDRPERDFHRLVAAAAYHLGQFSARAYSLIRIGIDGANLTKCELSIARLMLRELELLSVDAMRERVSQENSDDALMAMVAAAEAANATDDTSLLEVLDRALTDGFMGAIAVALLAFERGEDALMDDATKRLRKGMEGAAEFNLIALWWCHKLAIHMLRGLWEMSFHRCLPISGGPSESAVEWAGLRSLFIASLYRRKKSEIDLWPSQIAAAARALEMNANLVLSLPTSAGKTRIAELCILACLSTGKKVVFVTPLRALSAQTEIGLNRTFSPLGKSVSSLYGSMGVGAADIDALTAKDIVVATPEKLDFAIRNDPSLLDDVGLVILDEGHMIGLNEREVRYEAQIQRLLRRADASSRRVVCLSAILPDGEQLTDFVNWLTNDAPGGLVQKNWRPTRLRFGEVVWDKDCARLTITVGTEKPSVPAFFSAMVPSIAIRPKRKRTKAFPADQRELCLATAWRLVEDGQTVLIFCPLRSSVEPFADAIVDLHSRGALRSILVIDEGLLSSAIAIGTEWLGADHVLLQCLRLGVAIHHGALPSPYRREVERLLQSGVLKITVSSPTLAQGLNLAATSLIFHGLYRNGQPIDVSEFRNVVGRAGRAYVDVEGLVLFPIFTEVTKNKRLWKKFIDDQTGREMESGLVRLVATLLARISRKLGSTDIPTLLEYVAGNSAWDFTATADETIDDVAAEKPKWESYLTSLDTAIMSLLGDNTISDNDVERCLDLALQSSLFTRRLKHYDIPTQDLFEKTFAARAKFVWANSTPLQRRGYFLAGVGLQTGQALDTHSATLEALLVAANVALVFENMPAAADALCKFAEIIFTISPFVPKVLPENWRDVLATWISGAPIQSLASGATDDVLQFVEQGLIYTLSWGLEAVRVRGLAQVGSVAGNAILDGHELGLAVAALETGTTNRSASYLIQAGFGSRLAAIQAVADGAGNFTKGSELLLWLRSAPVVQLGLDEGWPSPETHRLWQEFLLSFNTSKGKTWKLLAGEIGVSWRKDAPCIGTALRLGGLPGTENQVYGADYEPLGVIIGAVDPLRIGLLTADVSATENSISWRYLGPG